MVRFTFSQCVLTYLRPDIHHIFNLSYPSPMDHRSSDVLMLATKHAHSRDARIVFVEEGHLYKLDGIPLKLSVTGLIESVSSDHFDPTAVIAKMKQSDRWPNPKYVQADGTTPLSDDEIKGMWKSNGERAAALGTDLHGKIELFLNGVDPVFTSDENRAEFDYFLNWWNAQLNDGWMPYRTEWVVFNESAQIAGSVDFLMVNSITGEYCLVDWKRCETKAAGFAKSFGKTFLPPANRMDQHKLNKWKIQINVYREMIERSYGLKISGMRMVVFHTENSEAKEFAFDACPEAGMLLDARCAFIE